LRGRWKADFDFRETHIDQQAEHALLAVVSHRIDQGLIAVAQIDRAPDRRFFDALRWPGAVVELRRGERRIFGGCIRHAFAFGYGSGLRRDNGLVHFSFPPGFWTASEPVKHGYS